MDLYKYHSDPSKLKHHDKPRHRVLPIEILNHAVETGKESPKADQIILRGSIPDSTDKWPLIDKYVFNVKKGRWPEYEKKLFNDVATARSDENDDDNEIYDAIEDLRNYQSKVLNKKPWPEAEKIYVKYPFAILEYALEMGRRFPEGESMLLKGHSSYAIQYAAEILKQRWPALEEKLFRDLGPRNSFGDPPAMLFNYIKTVVKGRWPEAEDYLKRDGKIWEKYQALVQSSGEGQSNR